MSTFQRGDKTIANASGQVVREDMEDTLKATAANNFGPRSSAGTILPAEFIADNSTTPKKLLIRATSGGDQADPLDSQAATFYEVGNLDEANLGLVKKAGDTFTGVLQAITGAAGAPSINFGDTSTGLFKSTTNAIGISAGGAERATVDSTGISINNQGDLRLKEASGNGSNYVALQSPASLSSNVSLTLPSTDGNDGEFLQTDGSGNLSFSVVQGVPSGSVFALAGTQTGVPSGYLECDGSSQSRSTYAALFAVIGTTYGSASGTTFNVPNLRGQFIRGVNTTGSGTDANRNIGSSQSEDNKSHNHSISLSGTTSEKSLTGSITKISETFQSGGGSASGVFTKTGGVNAGNTPSRVDSSPAAGVDLNASHNHTFSASGTSGDRGSETRPSNIAMMYIIKV